MAEMPPINITIDQDALRAQLDEAVTEATREFATKLRQAADDLDPTFWQVQQKWEKENIAKVKADAYQRGRDDERDARK